MRKTKRYLGARQVRERYNNVSDMTLWRWPRTSDFPQPEYINGRRYWDEERLDAWDEARASHAEPEAA